jgi:class 3 adenylate cyclase
MSSQPRTGYSSLTVERDRGVIWVCDISRSSSYMNSDDLAGPIEEFLPRLHWVSELAIRSIGGELIQWTGDGFIAWFRLDVERDLGRICNRILEAIWHFTTFVNITQLCVDSPKPFRIRHGLTYEPDALVTHTTHQDGHESKIISGRNVVLAFRLSGVESDFPNVSTQQRVYQAVSARTRNLVAFKRWTLSAEQLLRYFKGEKTGTMALYLSGSAKVNQPKADAWVSRAQRLLARVDGSRRPSQVDSTFVDNFYRDLRNSKDQDWCRESLDVYTEFLRNEMAGPLTRVLDVVGKLEAEEA